MSRPVRMFGSMLLTVAIGVCGAIALWGIVATAQEIAQVPPLGEASFGDIIADAAASPALLFVLRAIASIGIVIGLTEATRTKFSQLRDDTDAGSLRLRAVALSYGIFLGLVGLAPEVPAFTGRLSMFLGGVTCAVFSVASVGFWKSFVGARQEKAATKADVTP